MMKSKKLLICEPMNGKTFEQIDHERSLFIKTLDRKKYEPVGNLTPPEFIGSEDDMFEVKNGAIYCLAQSIDAMSRCDTVLFRPGWENARGCQIEHMIATEYGLEILYEDNEGNFYDNLHSVVAKGNF